MDAAAGAPRFSEALSDSVVALDRAISAQLSFLDDVASYFAARAALHRDSAKSLRSIVKKAQTKHASHVSALAVGEAPTSGVFVPGAPGSHHTLDAAWSTLLSEADEEAQDANNLAESLAAEVADALRSVERKKDELRKRQLAFHERLVAERDAYYARRTKAKAAYDAACAEVEQARLKDKHMDKARSHMAIAKTNYLLAIAQANAVKAAFYRSALPTLHEHAQSIMTLTVRRLIGILERHGAITSAHAVVLGQRFARVTAAVRAIDIAADQAVFVKANQRPFQEPTDERFEPCQVWHDTDAFIVDDAAAKTVMQNELASSMAKLNDTSAIANKEKERTGLSNLLTAYQNDGSLGDPDSVLDELLAVERDVIMLDLEAASTSAGAELLSDALGEDTGGGQPHALKAGAFPVAKPCVVCQASIWGVGRVGKTCKGCGACVHSRCERLLPATCKAAARQPMRPRTDSRASSANSPSSASFQRNPSVRSSFSGHQRATSATGSPLAPLASAVPEPARPPAPEPSAVAMFDYAATDTGELTVQASETVSVVAPDTDGWTTVRNARGQSGLVPTSYIEIRAATSHSNAPTPPAPRTAPPQSQHVYYAFEASAADELSVQPGDQVIPTNRPAGEGWIEVQLGARTGLVPAWALDAPS